MRLGPGGGLVVPSRDRGTLCADVADVRVCWGLNGNHDDCSQGVCVDERKVPPLDAKSNMGWRCFRSGSERECVDRRQGVGDFRCQQGRCEQLHPRVPDDREWSCADLSGAAVCVGGDEPAGVLPATAEPGWLCGARPEDARPIGRDGGVGRALCVDLSADFPDGKPTGWKCRYEYEGGARRICEKGDDVHVLGDRCARDAPCIDGARCVAGKCVPDRPSPSCWLDADCESGACRFGTCLEGSP